MAGKKHETTLQVQDDKLYHMCGAMGIVFVGVLALQGVAGILLGIVGAVSLGLGKEWYDLKYGTGWSWTDLAADALGVLVGTAVALGAGL